MTLFGQKEDQQTRLRLQLQRARMYCWWSQNGHQQWANIGGIPLMELRVYLTWLRENPDPLDQGHEELVEKLLDEKAPN
jgi:hypothetical protein